MSLTEISPQPRMLAQKFKGAVAFKQLKRFTNAHRSRHLNKKMYMVWSNFELVNAETVTFSSLSDKALTIAPNSIKLKDVPSVLGFPHKMESILPEGMFKTLQIHFFPPESARGKRAHANSIFVFHRGLTSSPLSAQEVKLDKFMEGRIPPMFESMGILRLM